MNFRFSIVVLILLSARAAHTETIFVDATDGNDTWSGRCADFQGGDCGPKRSIQAGLDAAAHGDIVQVADGTYTGDSNLELNFAGKAIWLRSENGPTACIIDGERRPSRRGFVFDDAEGPSAVVDGLTIMRCGGLLEFGGLYTYGLGVTCLGSSPRIRNCVIRNNIPWDSVMYSAGTGVYADELSHPMIEGSCFIQNTPNGADGSQGSGVLAAGGATIVECCFERNRLIGPIETGGVVAGGDGLLLLRCTFVANTSYAMSHRGRASIVDCVMEGEPNPDWFMGGVFVGSDSVSEIERCVIRGLKAGQGSGVRGYESTVRVKNCEIVDNAAYFSGGAVGMYRSTAEISNCTIVGNSAGSGSAMLAFQSAETFENCIVQDNSETPLDMTSSTLAVRYSNFDPPQSGPGNIDDAPQFIDADAGDYGLSAASPGVNSGDPTFAAARGETDLLGKKRVWGGRVDMGAHEFGSMAIGDLDCNGTVNTFDVSAFLLVFRSPARYRELYPDCEMILSDVNLDGSVNQFDIQPFVELLAD